MWTRCTSRGRRRTGRRDGRTAWRRPSLLKAEYAAVCVEEAQDFCQRLGRGRKKRKKKRMSILCALTGWEAITTTQHCHPFRESAVRVPAPASQLCRSGQPGVNVRITHIRLVIRSARGIRCKRRTHPLCCAVKTHEESQEQALQRRRGSGAFRLES